MPARPSCGTAIARDRPHPRSPCRLSPGRRERTPSRGTAPHRSLGLRTDVPDRPHRPLRRVTAPAPRERADRGDGQVRRRPHRELRGRDPRPAGNEPRAHGPSRCRSAADPGVRTVLGDPDDHDRGRHPPNGAGRAPPADVLDRLRRGLASGAGRAGARPPHGAGRGRGPARPSGPHDVGDHSVPRCRSGLAEPRRSAAGGERTSSWGCWTRASGPNTHRSADLGLGRFPLAAGCEFGDGSDPDLGAPFDCDRKLIGAYAFTDTYMSLVGALPGEFCDNDTGRCSARSGDGHGTHTASTAAGATTKASVFGLPRGRVSGMAPGARLIAYRVCLSLGCYSSDSVSAIEQAVLDGVDVINFSISGGADPYLRPRGAGVPRRVRRGHRGERLGGQRRSGPRDRRPRRPWVTTVGASYGPRAYMTTLQLRGSDGATMQLPGSTITRGVAGRTVVSAGRRRRIRGPAVQQPDGTRLRHGPRRGLRAREPSRGIEKSWNVQTWRRLPG